jgi:ribose transport system substrate-binding protein
MQSSKKGKLVNRQSLVIACTAMASAALLAACAAQSASPNAASNPNSAKAVAVTYDPGTHQAKPATDVSDWCGDKKLKIAVADGAPVNAWRTTALAVIKKEAALCPAIDPDILYTSAGGDQQKANSDINSLVAQGVDVLLVYPDFGPAELPAVRAATKAGLTVVTYSADVGGTPGKDYTATTVWDGFAAGETYGRMVAEHLKKGNIVFLGGIPGAPTSVLSLNGLKSVIKDHPGIKLLVSDPITTNWTKSGAQQAVTGLIAKYPKIDAVFTDFGVTAVGAINAFIAAGDQVPAIASFSTSNELGCLWKKYSDGPKAFPMFSVDSTPAMPMFALHQGVAAANGKPYNVIQKFQPPIVMDSPAGKDPACDPSLPPDADMTSPLTAQELASALKG